MTTAAAFLGMWAIGATVWALEQRSYTKAVKEDRNHWHGMYVKAAIRGDEAISELFRHRETKTEEVSGTTAR